MKFTVEIDCSNAAFGEDEFDRNFEVAHLLRNLAIKVEDLMDLTIHDSNGNKVGFAAFVSTNQE